MDKRKRSWIFFLTAFLILFIGSICTYDTAMAEQRASGDFDIQDGVLRKYSGDETEVTVPEGVTGIANWVFSWDDKIEKVTLPSTMKTIGNQVFYMCSSLREVEMQEGVETLGENTLAFCKKLEKATLPASIKTIGKNSLTANNGTWLLNCTKDTPVYKYALSHGISIGKLTGITQHPSAQAELSEILNVDTQEDLSGQDIQLTVRVVNNPETSHTYTEEDREAMALQEAEVDIQLPSELTFTDGTRSRTRSLGDIHVASESAITEDVTLVSTIATDSRVTCSLTLRYSGKKNTFSRDLSSYGVGMVPEKAAKLQKYPIDTEETLYSTDCTSKVEGWYDLRSNTAEYRVGEDYYVFYLADDDEHWELHGVILDKDYKIKRKLDFPYIEGFEKFGGVIVDKDGYFYVVCGHDDSEHTEANSTEVLKVVRYDPALKESGSTAYTSLETGSGTTGTRYPFSFGDCDLAIDSRGRLVGNMALVMYNGHQRSRAISIDTKTMEKLEISGPYCSHSLGQQVYITDTDEAIFINKGDYYPRGLQFAKLNPDHELLKSSIVFHCSSGKSYQNTLTSLGGVAEMADGYLLAACSEKLLACNALYNNWVQERNVFIQLIKKDFPNEAVLQDMQLLDTEPRYASLSAGNPDDKIQDYTVDHGVLWLTHYKGNEYASAVKLVRLTDTTSAVFWEKSEFINGKTQHRGTYYCVIDQYGNIMQGETELPDTRLNSWDEMIYDGRYVTWTTKPASQTKGLILNQLEIDISQDTEKPSPSPGIQTHDPSATNPGTQTHDPATTAKPGAQMPKPSSTANPGTQTHDPSSTARPGTQTQGPSFTANPGTQTQNPASIASPGAQTHNPPFTARPATQTPDPASAAKPGEQSAPPIGTILTEPRTKMTYQVTRKGKSVAFYKPPKKNITRVVIPPTVRIDNITYKVAGISGKAFHSCTNLKNVILGKNITDIGNRAFYRCTNLKKITLPAKVRTIGKKTFYGCSALQKIIIRTKKLRSVGNGAIRGIHKKAVITVPKGYQKKYQKLFDQKAGYQMRS